MSEHAFESGSKPVSEHALGKWYDHLVAATKRLPQGLSELLEGPELA